MIFPFDPIERAQEVEKVVTKDLLRKYHRFRPAPYYGGIATADAVGCCFLCAYCWNYYRNLDPMRSSGKFYSPEDVANILLGIMRKKGVRLARITGAEPILGEYSFEHFLRVLDLTLKERSDLTFVLETNGLLLGYREDFVERLPLHKNLSVRIAIKGWDEDSFEKVTGAKKDYFIYPLLGLRNLRKRNIDAWPAAMEDIFGKEGLSKLRKRLNEAGVSCELETESLERYPYVMENLKRRNVTIEITKNM